MICSRLLTPNRLIAVLSFAVAAAAGAAAAVSDLMTNIVLIYIWRVWVFICLSLFLLAFFVFVVYFVFIVLLTRISNLLWISFLLSLSLSLFSTRLPNKYFAFINLSNTMHTMATYFGWNYTQTTKIELLHTQYKYTKY